MSIILPCDDPYLRAAATQRPSYRILATQYLPLNVERLMSQVLEREVHYHIQIEQQKKDLEGCFDFNVRRAFKAIDELRYNYINEQNLKLFLRKMGHHVLKKEITAILRRFDLDGDSKLSFQEFNEGIKPVILV